jgi:hypothetical protein
LVRFDFIVQLLTRIPYPETLGVAKFVFRIAFNDSPVAGSAIQALHHIDNLDSFPVSLVLTLHPLSSGRLNFGEREVLNRDLPGMRLRICGRLLRLLRGAWGGPYRPHHRNWLHIHRNEAALVGRNGWQTRPSWRRRLAEWVVGVMLLVVREPESDRPGRPMAVFRIQQLERLSNNLRPRQRPVTHLEEAADVAGEDSLLSRRHRSFFVSVRYRPETGLSRRLKFVATDSLKFHEIN